MNIRTQHDLPRQADQMTRHLSEQVLQSAHEAVESTRDLARHALHGADSAIRRARGRIDPAVEDLASSAQHLAHRGRDIAALTGTRARQSLKHCAAATERYVADQPVRAVLIAAAAGAIVAGLALMATARKRRNAARDHD